MTASGQTVGPPLSGAMSRNTTNTKANQQLRTENSVEREYFDEIYQMKQIAARRKLAYENNQIGRVKQRKGTASSKDWAKTKSIGKNRNRLALSMTSKPGEDQPRLTNL